MEETTKIMGNHGGCKEFYSWVTIKLASGLALELEVMEIGIDNSIYYISSGFTS